MFERIAATQLASVLLLFAFALILARAASRGRQRFTQGMRRGPATMPLRLTGLGARGRPPRRALAVLTLAFLLPVGQLAWWAHRGGARGPRLARLPRAPRQYAVPGRARRGGRLRLRRGPGLCGPTAPHPGSSRSRGSSHPWATRCPARSSRWESCCRWPGWTTARARCSSASSADRSGLFLTGSAIGLVGAYVVRFLAVSLQTVDASLTGSPPSSTTPPDPSARERAACSAACTCR